MNLFEKAAEIQKEAGKRVRKSVSKTSPIVLKRDGKVVRNTVERKVEEVKIKKRKVRVDNSDVVPESETLAEERKELGKRVYNERYQVMLVLMRGYGVEKSEIEDLSLVSLLARLDLEKAKQAGSLQIGSSELDEDDGDILKGFRIVSSVKNVITGVQGMMSYRMRQEEIRDRAEQQLAL